MLFFRVSPGITYPPSQAPKRSEAYAAYGMLIRSRSHCSVSYVVSPHRRRKRMVTGGHGLSRLVTGCHGWSILELSYPPELREALQPQSATSSELLCWMSHRCMEAPLAIGRKQSNKQGLISTSQFPATDSNFILCGYMMIYEGTRMNGSF